MLSVNNINEMHIDREVTLEKTRLEEQDAYSTFSFVYKKMFNRLNTLITETTSELQDQTGWRYTKGCLTKLTDFGYDGNEIIFTVNELTNDGNGFMLSDEPLPEEVRLFTEYHDELVKLSLLEKRKAQLLPSKDSKIVSINSARYKGAMIRKNKQNNKYYDYTEEMADTFEEKYGEMGIAYVISFLNGLNETDNAEQVYDAFVEQGFSKEMLDDILKVADLFDPRVYGLRTLLNARTTAQSIEEANKRLKDK